MRIHVPLVALFLLSGCDYSLRIPFPKVESYASTVRPRHDFHVTMSVEPTSPALGETATVTCSGLEAGYYYAAYLSYGTAAGGDLDKPDPSRLVPYFKVGNLVPVGTVASVSFDVRGLMGNDQNGDPFKLSRGQLVTVAIKGQPVDSPEGYFLQSGGSGGSFLIR